MYKKGGRKNMNQQLIDEIRTMPNNVDSIAKITQKIIRDLKSKEFPIPIVKIMKELNFLVGTQELEDNLSGYIVISEDIVKKFGNDKLICVNSKDSFGHQRFTIAHELAHFLFDYAPVQSDEYYNTYRTDDVDDEKEQRANKFAANLLMPEEEFRAKYEELRYDDDKLAKLIKYFEVSKKAVLLRIRELEIV